VARKDLDTAISLSLLASRWEELRGPLLSSLQQLLPVIGNALAVFVAFGEAHVYMWQQYRAAEGAKARWVVPWVMHVKPALLHQLPGSHGYIPCLCYWYCNPLNLPCLCTLSSCCSCPAGIGAR
jgi:hypothetical protein